MYRKRWESVSNLDTIATFGSLDRERRDFIKERLGYDVVVWNVDSGDWRNGCAPEGFLYGNLEGHKLVIYDVAQPFVQAGQHIVLLLHDHHYKEGLAKWLKDYFATELGYEFVRMNECCKGLADCVTPDGHTVWDD